jgi:hypothetical protein
MSYRLITKAVFTITNSAGATTEREVEVRAYPAPKREAAGQIDVDGTSVAYKRTGGKGRGAIDTRYVYATVKGESAYWAITEAEATALIGGQAKIKAIAKPVEQPKPAEAPKVELPDAPTNKAQRREKAKA